jgi:predicted phage tail component-like protein
MITFNNIYLKDYFSKIKKITRPLIPEQELTTVVIPKRAGALLVNRRDGVRVVTVTFVMYEKDLEALQKKFDAVKPHLIVDEPAPMTFDDQPGRTYYAMISGNTDIDQKFVIGENEIQFVCLDPYGYGPDKTANTTTGKLSVDVDGNKETFPLYEFTFKQPSTAIAVQKDGKRLLVGIPENVDLTTVNPRSLFLHDDMSSLTNWVESTAGVDGGTITGNMAIQDGSRFYPSSYGTGSGWHGPARHRVLSKDLQDFEAELTLTQNNAFADRLGRVEIYLTDGSDHVIAKLAMKDISKDFSNNHGEVRLGTLGGGEYLVSKDSNNSGWWNNFTGGKIFFKREGKRISGRIARVDQDGHEFNIQYFDFYDRNNDFQRPFRRIRVHIGANGTAGPTTQTMDDIKIYELNVVNEQSIPIIANIGDVITVNMADGEVRKNGYEFPIALNYLSHFIPLQPGENTVEIFPNGKADTKVTYQDRWL